MDRVPSSLVDIERRPALFALVPAGRRLQQHQQPDGIEKRFGDLSQPQAYHFASPRHTLSCNVDMIVSFQQQA
jgi:hypothetical protein